MRWAWISGMMSLFPLFPMVKKPMSTGELLIASASLQELDSAPKSIAIPDELMENAGIMPDADIQIICGQGVILITAQASMSTSELREVLQSLYLQYFI